MFTIVNHCAVQAAAAATDKPVILVSEKLGSAGELHAGFFVAQHGSARLHDGVFILPACAAGLDLLNQFGVADCSYELTPQQLCEKVKNVDALIVRSATKVGWFAPTVPDIILGPSFSCAQPETKQAPSNRFASTQEGTY